MVTGKTSYAGTSTPPCPDTPHASSQEGSPMVTVTAEPGGEAATVPLLWLD